MEGELESRVGGSFAWQSLMNQRCETPETCTSPSNSLAHAFLHLEPIVLHRGAACTACPLIVYAANESHQPWMNPGA